MITSKLSNYLPLLGLMLGQPMLGIQPDPAAELAALQAKYPQQSVILEKHYLDVNIELVNGKPVFEHNEFTSFFILGDNTTYMADSKDYFSSKEEVKKIEAYSLVPEGGKYKKLSVNKFTKTSEIGDGVFFDDQFAYSYTFPSVVKGAKTVSHSQTVSGDCYMPVVFYFGRSLPVEDSRITITCPKEVKLITQLFGYDTTLVKHDVITKGNLTIHTWQSSLSRSYLHDGLAPSVQHYTPHLVVNVESYLSNGAVTPVMGSTADLYRHNYSKIENINQTIAIEIQQLADSITMGCGTSLDKVKAIYRWVQQNIKYVAIEDGENGMVPRQANLVLQRRYGDCKDKSSILVSLMKAQHLNASMVWVGTRDLPYSYKTSPSVLVDNHMIACWWDENNQPVLLDGTSLYHSLGEIPAFIQGKECLIEKGKDDFMVYTIPVALPQANLAVDSLLLTISHDSIVGQGIATHFGEEKTNMMHAFAGRDPKRFNDIVLLRCPKATNKYIVNKASVSDCQNNDQPLTIHYDFALPGYIGTSNGNYYINLNLDRPFQNLVINPDRWLPIESEYTFLKRMVCILNVPDDYVISQIPDAAQFNNELFGFTQVYQQKSNQVVLTTNITLNFQILEGDEVGQFRDMIAKLNRSCLKSIVLTKK